MTNVQTVPLPEPRRTIARCHHCKKPLQSVDSSAGDYCYIFRKKPTCIECCCQKEGR